LNIIAEIHKIAHHLMLKRMQIMRTTIVLDDVLLAKAQDLTQLREKTALIKEALKALIERESAKRLACLGGSEPQLDYIPRRHLPL
jgi:Arc/MetJ family transcription regulator